ncbi:hypothetical protein LPJ56_001073 [Coemansia sp. RSA 2599]|nr:hypothetical protein LPJ75_000638 [Coemansia sp. RSA 2598]KAJ1828499.1 hypothetical protein LPJ56_001073 [Coemansia sp. RSA 2599]
MWAIEGDRVSNRLDIYRKPIWSKISGKVLELGPGYAQSLQLLQHTTLKDGSEAVDPAVIKSYTVIEPNTFFYGGLQKNAETNGFRVSYDTLSYPEGASITTMASGDENPPFMIVKGSLDDPNNIPQAVLDEAPYDSIVTSFSLCTAKDLEASLANIFKLLRPGGTFYFIEHVRHPAHGDPMVVEDNGVNAYVWSKIQDLLNPLWKIFTHGCYLNRRTNETIANMSCWKSVDYKTVRTNMDIEAKLLPLSFGKAIKPLN